MTAAEQNSSEPARRTGRPGPAPLDSTAGRWLRKAWAVMSFTGFAVGALLSAVFVFPVLALLVRDPVRRREVTRATIGKLFGAFLRFMGLAGLSWDLKGLPVEGGAPGCVIVANHPTLIDAVYLLWLFPGADCVVKAAHWRNPITAVAVRAAGYLPNDDDERLLEAAVERLQAGGTLVLFPQGTRTRPGEEPQFRRGAAVIAARAGADLLPVRITCEPPVLRKGDPWFLAPPRRPHFTLEALPRLSPERWTAEGERAGTVRLTERLSELLLEAVH